MRHRRLVEWLGLCSIVLIGTAMRADGQAVGSVSVLSQERRVDAQARITAGIYQGESVPSDTVESDAPGLFEETASARVSGASCCCGHCLFHSSAAEARQQSAIGATADGALEIRAVGSARASASGPATSEASSSLTVSFAVDEGVAYLLKTSGAGTISVVLRDEHGPVLEHTNPSSGLVDAGSLPPGFYTLAIEADRRSGDGPWEQVSHFDVRLTAGGVRPRCLIQMSRPRYAFGDVVTATAVRVENTQPHAVPVELKMWLRLPNGQNLPARNDGADGMVSIPGATSFDFGPLPVMGVDADVHRGQWEFGCRLLNPTTGQQLDHDYAHFAID